MKSATKNRYLILALLLFMGVSVFFSSLPYDQLLGDDYTYSFVISPTNQYGSQIGCEQRQHIKTLSDIIHSQVYHWLTVNGRFVVHCVVQFFAGIAGKQCFNVCNAVVFACLLYLICINVGLTLKDSVWLWAIVISLFWWLAPLPTVINGIQINHSVNYLWASTAMLFFLQLFQHKSKHDNNIKLILLFIFSLLAGNLHESFVLGIAVYATLELWLNRKRGRNMRQIVMTIGLLIGVSLLVLSPGSLRRIHGNGTDTLNLALRLKCFVLSLSFYTTAYLLPLTILVCKFADKEQLNVLLNKYYAYIVIVAVQFVFVVLVSGSNVNKRSMFAVDFFSLMFMLAVVKHYACLCLTNKQLMKGLGIACACSLFILNMGIIYSCYLSEKSFKLALKTAVEGDGTACLSYRINPCYSRYVSNYYEDYSRDLTTEPGKYNKDIRLYFFDSASPSRDEQ